jgi:hypothetical protein
MPLLLLVTNPRDRLRAAMCESGTIGVVNRLRQMASGERSSGFIMRSI